MNIFVFDIETVPDTTTGKRLYELPNNSDTEIAHTMLAKRREETGGSEFLPLHLHRIVAISVALKTPTNFNIWSLGDKNSDEQEIIRRFFNGIEKYIPTLVSWNGSGFDLPVLHYRSLLHGISAKQYWEVGDNNQNFRWNNYLNRYHYRHIDIMDILACYQPRAYAKLDEIAVMIGLPGKIGIGGNKVCDNFFAGNIKEIRDYCEVDVLNTYLIFQRFQLIQNKITNNDYQQICCEIKDFLEKHSDKIHWKKFLDKWKLS